MISIENKLSKLSKDNLQKICKMMKKKHMQDDSKQRLMEILMKPLGKKYKIFSGLFKPRATPRARTPKSKRRTRTPHSAHAPAPPPPHFKKPRETTPRHQHVIDYAARIKEEKARIKKEQQDDEYDEIVRKHYEKNLLLRLQEIAMNIIILFKYYRLSLVVLKGDVLNGFISTQNGIDEIWEVIRTILNKIPYTINEIVAYLKRNANDHLVDCLLVKTNNIVIQYRYDNEWVLKGHLRDLYSKLNVTMQQNHSVWHDNLLKGIYDNSCGRFIPI
jgi:hypothetical protein